MDLPISLKALQLSFKDAVSRPRYLDTASPDEVSFCAEIQDGHGITPDERIEIYSYAYSARIMESLEDDFEGVRGLIEKVSAEDRFREILELFLKEYPSRSTSLVDVGRAFPLFLKSLPEAREFPFVYDLAQLDWAKVVAFYGPTSTQDRDKPFDFAELSSLSPEQWPEIRLVLDPALALLELDYPVNELFASHELASRRCWLSVHRLGMKCEVTELSAHQFKTLKLIEKGLKLGQIAEAFTAELESGEQIPFMEWFLAWARDGVIVAAEI